MSENLKEIVADKLKQMGCSNINIEQMENDTIIVTFDCNEITSFKAEIAGWKYSGIGLSDNETSGKYKIEFQKIA